MEGVQSNILYETPPMNMCEPQRVQFRNCLFPSAQEKRELLKLAQIQSILSWLRKDTSSADQLNRFRLEKKS